MAQSDMSAIINTINLYGLAIDTMRFALFDQVFTPDVEADYGPLSTWLDLDTFKRDFLAFHDPLDATQHAMLNHVVNVQEDTAQAVTYVHWLLIREGLEDGSVLEGNSWYSDDLVRVGNEWLIRRRRCRNIWAAGNRKVVQSDTGVRVAVPNSSLRKGAAVGEIEYINATIIS